MSDRGRQYTYAVYCLTEVQKMHLQKMARLISAETGEAAYELLDRFFREELRVLNKPIPRMVGRRGLRSI